MGIMNIRQIVASVCIVCSMTGAATGSPVPFEADYFIERRPSNGELVQDATGALADIHDYADDYLKMLRDQYGMEAMIVSIPATGPEMSTEDVALRIMESWRIWAQHGGRGLLLLLVDDTKQIKMEVARELEDVFTDAFTGYIEDKQLKNHYLAGDVSTGLVAVMEEIEKRARVRSSGEYDKERISMFDEEFISQGAGAGRDLTGYTSEDVSDVGAQYPAGATPEEAWQTMIRSYQNKVRDHKLGVYTAITRLAYRDYTNLPDSFYVEEYDKYVQKSYEIIERGDYAVVFFGNKKGWDNAPFLLSRTDEGWQFDIVHQRKFIRMGQNPHWMMERANYPHAWHLSKCPWSMGQDIPLEGEDRYRIKEDGSIAGEILALEDAIKAQPDDFETLMRLGRLYVKTAFNRKAIPLLKKCKQLDPVSSLPYKYLAIAYVDAFYQYQSAITELEEFVRREPEDVFGLNYLGYLYLHENKYDKAIQQLEKAVDLRPDNIYAYCKLARAYGQKYLDASMVDVFKGDYKNKALAAYESAQNADTPNELRVWWLKLWLEEEGLLK